MFQTQVVEKIKTHILCSVTLFRKSIHLWDNVEKHGAARQATYDNMTRRMHIACLVPKATHTHTHARARARAHAHTHTHTLDMQYFLLFHGTNGYANAPRWYVIRALFCWMLKHAVRKVTTGLKRRWSTGTAWPSPSTCISCYSVHCEGRHLN
jgi:hypothetical protein